MSNDPIVEASLGLGGNMGDVTDSFIGALESLANSRGVVLRRVSSIYRTPPWGKLDQPSFLNLAALVETTLPARDLLALLLGIEEKMGRRRLERWGPRTLDIDLLTYGELEINELDLQVPHPRIAERAFVLAPLAEIVPRLRIGDREVIDLVGLVDIAGIDFEPAATDRMRASVGAHLEYQYNIDV